MHCCCTFQMERSNIPSPPSLSWASNTNVLEVRRPHEHLKSQPVTFAPPSLFTGILKFHEVYLGEGVSEGGSEFQEGGGGGGGVISGSSLEQHIASAREALGVESYYSRWDVHSCHSEMKILLSVCELIIQIITHLLWSNCWKLVFLKRLSNFVDYVVACAWFFKLWCQNWLLTMPLLAFV